MEQSDCVFQTSFGRGRIIRIGGKLPIKLSAGLFYNVVHRPTAGAGF
jgi:hypothetical protein